MTFSEKVIKKRKTTKEDKMKRRLLGLLLSTCVVLTLAFLSTGGAFAETDLSGCTITVTESATYLYETENGEPKPGTDGIPKGIAQEPTITVTDGTDTLVRDTDYTVSYTPVTPATGTNLNPTLDSDGKPLNAGIYTVTITGTGNYTGTVTKEFTINKAEGFANGIEPKSGLYYTGREQELITEPTSRSGEVQYSINADSDERDWKTDIPKATSQNGGQFYIYYRVLESDNYNAVAETKIGNGGSSWIGKVSFKIKAKDKTMEVGGALPVNEYTREIVNGQGSAPAEAGVEEYLASKTATYKYYDNDNDNEVAVNDLKLTRVGTYTIKVEISELYSDSNYEIDVENGTLTIEARKVVAPTASSKTYTYTGQELTYEFATSGDSKYYTVTGDKMMNAGTQTVTVALKDKVNTKWSDGTTDDKTFTFTIAKAAATVKVADQTMTVGGTLPTNSYTATGLKGADTLTGTVTYTYTNSEGTAYTADTIDCSKAGTYTITASGLANDNYDVTYTAGKLTINARSYSGSSRSSSTKTDTNATDTEKKDTDATGTDTKDTETAEETAAKVEAAKTGASSASAKARSEKTSKGYIKVVFKPDTKTQKFIDEMKAQGYTVKYRFYRSTKKSSDYKSMLTKSTKTYINTLGEAGTRYYYKAQVRVYDGSGKLIAKTALKQCKYATRIF